MGREVRMVRADWQHPKYPDGHSFAGRYVPLYEGGRYAERAAEWDEEFAQWQAGFKRSYGTDQKWEARDAGDNMRFSEWGGERPSPDDYMPDWPEAERTHLMMYEDTSEGTPISPAFATPEELARWLADNGASSFGDMTATYEQWLHVAKGGWAPSMVIDNGHMMSGVEAAAQK